MKKFLLLVVVLAFASVYFLSNQNGGDTKTALATPTAIVYSNCPNGPSFPDGELVTSVELHLRLRNETGPYAAQVGLLKPGEPFMIEDTPLCDQQFVWQQGTYLLTGEQTWVISAELDQNMNPGAALIQPLNQ